MKKPRKKTNSADTTLVAVWMPMDMAARLNAEAKARDLDRSKLIRQAIRHELSRPA